jgi:hypothetical protein
MGRGGGTPPCWNHASQGNCGIVSCSNISRYEWLVMVASWKKKGPTMRSFVMSHHTLIFGMSLWCSIFWGGCSYICSCYHSNGILHQKNKESMKSHPCQFAAAFPQSLSPVMVGWLDVLSKLQFVCTQTWTFVYNNMKFASGEDAIAYFAVRINLCGWHESLCMIRSVVVGLWNILNSNYIIVMLI